MAWVGRCRIVGALIPRTGGLFSAPSSGGPVRTSSSSSSSSSYRVAALRNVLCLYDGKNRTTVLSDAAGSRCIHFPSPDLMSCLFVGVDVQRLYRTEPSFGTPGCPRVCVAVVGSAILDFHMDQRS
ncbi:hypothetical protein VOLCADRAFT_127320 [Volvox carteri f. nagariensis]|uniref:Uncharacterized protein gon1 n=1 Tax=Volvox carteri f. nagariensis TaxID=3068 RepID=D8UID3_VOLCA|nr:uncharacterized protein VOLCADRAFT_127320 [Volvox carteri f. nagariensis]EFJ40508.1 hypothetical protein VOLCADRAFT_127320 [Volvox carteri f. nagariensis]|eukprot:XP_002958432.1 hypothetical protein VOLCADRAFT_127320 [Volvox carteri f. nagariensis]